jgi:hypothetical protein
MRGRLVLPVPDLGGTGEKAWPAWSDELSTLTPPPDLSLLEPGAVAGGADPGEIVDLLLDLAERKSPVFPHDVFISYAHGDGVEHATQLNAELATHGLRVWMDPVLRHGERVDEEIRVAIEAAVAFVPVLTPGWRASDYCSQEAEWALAAGSAIIPIFVDGAREPFADHHGMRWPRDDLELSVVMRPVVDDLRELVLRRPPAEGRR